jgi:phosphate transport system substrate-binding protein
VIALCVAGVVIARSVMSQPIRTPAKTAPVATSTPWSGLVGQIHIAGSSTVQPLAEMLAAAFMAQNAGVVIDVQGGGSSIGVNSVGEGTVDIGTASRTLKSTESTEFPELQVFTIGHDGIAIVTHPGTSLPSLSIEQVRDIFAGEITNYSAVGGPDETIILVSRDGGSGSRWIFEEMVMDYGQEKSISRQALQQQSNGQVRTTVAATPNAIGYLSFGYLDGSIKPVAIDGVEPSTKNVQAGKYAIVRPLNMLTNGTPNAPSQAFLDFVSSQEGQSIVAKEWIAVQ